MAKSADVLILDWHLAGSDPTHCISIIESLLGVKETRFILILTQHGRATEEFKRSFAGRFSMDGEFALSKDGKHVAFMQKPSEGGKEAATNILAVIERLMTTAFPDYIHWAALEIAANIKKFSPRWLEALPRGMDWALLSEYCHDGGQASAIVIENLLEDLGHCILPEHLESTMPENCQGQDWAELASYCDKLDPEIGEVERKLLRLEIPAPCLNKGLPDSLSKSASGAFLPFVDSQKAFSSFCESVSPNDNSRGPIHPGSVFVKANQEGYREIYVCVSQACDCLHSAKLLMIRGKKERSTKLGSTMVSFRDQCYRFDAETKNLLTCDVEELDGQRSPAEYKVIGQLRAATARRLATRFWNYTTRSAVNISAFTRAERSGE